MHFLLICINEAVDNYQGKEYELAYSKFHAVNKVNDLLIANKEDIPIGTDAALANAATCAGLAGKHDEAIKLNQHLYDKTGEVKYRIKVYNAMKEKGQTEEAFALLKEIQVEDPSNIDVLTTLVNYYIENKKLEQGLEYINKAIDVAPDNAQLYFVRGNAYKETGDIEKAVESYNKSVELDPENVGGYLQYRYSSI